MSTPHMLCHECKSLDFSALYSSALNAERRLIIDIEHNKHSALTRLETLQRSAVHCLCCNALARELGKAITTAELSPTQSIQEALSSPLILRIAPVIDSSRYGTAHQVDSLHCSYLRHVDLKIRFAHESLDNVEAVMRIAASENSGPDSNPDIREGLWHGRIQYWHEFHCRIPSVDLTLEVAKRNIQTWSSNCREHHNCCSLIQSLPLPDRVLDVGTTQEPCLRLYEASGEKSSYNALSYCWGVKPQIMTNLSNYEAFKVSIDEQALPSTIRHAIALTRSLGVIYLWIDALCIIQDDALDWQTQSSKMADIYRGSHLTICAANGFNVHEDMISRRIPAATEIGVTNEDSAKRPIYLLPGLTSVTKRDYFTSTVLGSRAWCFQERLTSMRKVFFLEDQMAWECREDVAFETGVSFRHTVHEILAGSAKIPQGFDWSCYLEDLSWTEVVHMYTQCRLTKLTDSFPALAAIARLYVARSRSFYRLVESNRDYVYVAGLWKHNLAETLLWRIQSEGTARGQASTKWWAPSWSWAASLKPVKFLVESNPGSLLASIKDHQVQLDGPDPFGAITTAQISLHGPVLEVHLPAQHGAYTVSGLDHEISYQLKPSEAGGVSQVDHDIYFDQDIVPARLFAVLVLGDLVMLQRASNLREAVYSGLFLTEDPSGSSFTRVGVFWNCSIKSIESPIHSLEISMVRNMDMKTVIMI